MALSISDAGSEIVITGDSYRLSVSKTNGSLGRISSASGRTLSLGSRNQCLWGTVNTAESFFGGCQFSAQSATRRFSYSIDQTGRTVRLSYQGTAADAPLSAEVLLIAHDDSVELALTLRKQAGERVQRVLWPSDVLFEKASISEAYLPSGLPGIRLAPDFFTQGRSYAPVYPSFAMMMDYMALRSDSAVLAISAINPDPTAVYPTSLGFINDGPANTFFSHEHRARLDVGAEWQGPRYRITVASNVFDTLEHFRRDNRIDRIARVQDRLLAVGAGGLERATWIKMSPSAQARSAQAMGDFITALPHPTALHLVSYWQGGFDRNYPDFLPPDPTVGSSADLARLSSRLRQAGGHLVPYTNPTFWQEDSVTVRGLTAEQRNGLWV